MTLAIVWLLLRQRGRLAWNRHWRGPRRLRHILGALAMALVAIVFVVLAGLNTGVLIDSLARSAPEAAREALPAVLLGGILLTLVTSFSSAFHHLFLAGDLELLLASPVPPHALFWLKVLETWRDSVHLLLFEAAALFGYGQAFHAGLGYYVLALLIGLLLTIGATALGVAITLVVARIRFGESLLGLTRLLSILLFIPVGVLGVPALGARGRNSPFLGAGNVQAIATGLHTLGPPPAWSPTTWASDALLGEPDAPLSLALLVGLGVGLFGAAQLTFDRAFPRAWERVRYAPPRPPRAPVRLRLPSFGRRGSGAVLGILAKDWRVLVRDPRWRTSAVVSLVALGLPVLVVSLADPGVRFAPLLRFWVGLFPVPYLAYIFGSQFGAATLAYEGRNLALLRASPMGIGRILVAKLLGGLVVVLPVTLLGALGLALARGGGLWESLEVLGVATWMAVGATLAALAAACLTVDFESDHPQRRVGFLGAALTSALSMFFFISHAALLGWLLLRASGELPRRLVFLAATLQWGLVGLALLSIGLILVAVRLGLRRLATWEAS